MFRIFILFLISASLYAQDRLYVVQGLDESLGEVELGTGNVNANVLSLGLYCNDIVQCGNHLFVTNSGFNSIQEIDPITNATIREISLVDSGGVNPWSLTSVNSDTIAVSCSVSNNVLLVRLSDGQVIGHIDPGLSPEGILAYGNRIFVCLTRFSFPNYGAGVVMIYNRTTFQYEDSISVGMNPQYAAVDNVNRLHVACTGDYGSVMGEIRVIDLVNLQTISTLSLGGTPNTVSFGGDFGFVSAGGWGDAGFVYKYRLSDLAILNDQNNPLQTGAGATDVEAVTDGSFYVSCFANDVIEHRSAEGNLIMSYPVSDGPGYMLLYSAQNAVNPERDILPQSIELSSAYPNPFNGMVTIKFSALALFSDRVLIYNSLGQKVSEISIPSGISEIKWIPRNSVGNNLPSGIYYAKLNSNISGKIQSLIYMK